METNLPPRHVDKFDEVRDVLVIGYGFAGAATSIEAHDRGLDVLMIEKMDVPGGISITSGGGFRIATDSAGAFEYLKATNAGTTPDDVLQAIAVGMTEMVPYFEKLASVDGAEIHHGERRGSYNFPGNEAFAVIQVMSVPGFDARRDWPHVQGGLGPNAFKLLLDNVAARGIDVSLSTTALRLITGDDNEVRGAWIERGGERLAVGARHGVVLCCGGFEGSPEMQRQYFLLGAVRPAAFRGNTGDGIRMAVDVGADLWHMWHFHGSYGYYHPDPDYPFAIRMKQLPTWAPGGVKDAEIQMAWILVDRNGRRFTNEYVPYVQDTGHRALEPVDTVAMDYPYVPCYAIVDDVGRQLYPLGKPNLNDTTVTPYEWSDDNKKEIEIGILKQADTIAGLAEIIGCDADVLEESVARWNEACRAGHDADYDRPPVSMVPIEKPPFLVGEMWPLISNTQGGPVHDPCQRVLNAFGEPIPRLFEAGELGSIWGWLYMSGSNLTECLITGRTAGREVSALAPWDDA